jgi:hypothetical protein
MPTDDLTDDFLESSFAATLRQMANSAPAIGFEGMAADAARRGRRRTRRRQAAVGAAALTVLLAGGGAVVAWPGPTDTVGAASGASGTAATPQPGTGRSAAGTPASATPTTRAVPAAPVSATQLLEHLKSLLPTWTLPAPLPTAPSPRRTPGPRTPRTASTTATARPGSGSRCATTRSR